jgi:hypothetical protein
MRDWDKALAKKGLVDWLVGAGLFVGSLLVYVDTLAPSVATIFDDSLEFQLVCYLPGIAHPTGYPLYTLLGKLFTFLPLADVAFRVNLMSAFFASLTVAILYPTLKLMTEKRVPAILGAAIFAVSPVFWSQAVIAEVYTLNTAFMALTICLLLAWARTYEEPSPRSSSILSEPTTLLSLLALVYGLSLTHHLTMLLLAPAAVIFLLLTDRRPFTNVRFLVRLAVLFLAPLSLYLYIPLRGTTMSSLDGVYQNTLQGFITHITASSYGAFLTENPLQQSRDLAFYQTLLRDQFTWVGIIVGALGLVWSLRKPKVALLLIISFLTIALFVAGYQVSDIQVFLISLFLICALWIGAGLAALREFFIALEDRFAGGRLPRLRSALYLFLLLGGALLPLHLWQANRADNDLSHNWEVHDYGVDVLSQPLEEDAVIVGILGEMTLVNYFQQTEGMRPELVTIPADEEGERLAVVKAQMEAGHAVYLTRPLSGIAGEYHLSSLGQLIRVRERPATIPDIPSHSLSLPFGDAILLTGYDAHLRDNHLGQSLRLTLYWEALGESEEDYKVSVRLLDEAGHLAGVQDAFPVRDAYRTEAWRPGETIIDTFDLPILAGTPPGDYAIQVSMYQPDTLTPLATASLGNISPAATMNLEQAGPWDVQHRVVANLGGRLTLLGYSVIGQEFKPGDVIPLTFLWQGLAELEDEYQLILWLEDQAGVKRGEARLPLGGNYPSANWAPWQIVRDWQPLLVPGNVDDGKYRLKMQVLAGERALPRMYWLLPGRAVLDLGTIEVKGRERSFTVPPMEHPLEMRLGETVRLMGYDLEPTEAHPGDSLHLTLYWQGLGLMDTSYTVFLHLLDEEGNIRGQRDSVPGQGILPTSGWAEGEFIVDAYEIPIGSDSPPGPYTIAVGMYDAETGDRLPVFDAEGSPLGDHISLSGIDLSTE